MVLSKKKKQSLSDVCDWLITVASEGEMSDNIDLANLPRREVILNIAKHIKGVYAN